MSPRWRVEIRYEDGRVWRSFNASERGARGLYRDLGDPEHIDVRLIRRSDDRKGWIEIARKTCPALLPKIAD